MTVSTPAQAGVLLLPAFLMIASGVLFRWLLLSPVRARAWWPWAGFLLERSDERMVLWLRERLAGGASSWFETMQPEWIAAYLARRAQERLSWILEQALAPQDLVLWENLPRWARERVMQRLREDLPATIDSMIEELAEGLDRYVDLPALVARACALQACDRKLYARLFPLNRAFIFFWAICGLGLASVLLVGVSTAVRIAILPISLLLPWWAGKSLWLHLPLTPGLDDQLEAALLESLQVRTILAAVSSGEGEEFAQAILARHIDALLQHAMTTRAFVRLLGAAGVQRLRQRAHHLARPMLLSCLKESALLKHVQPRVQARLQRQAPSPQWWRRLQGQVLGASHAWLMLLPALLLALWGWFYGGR